MRKLDTAGLLREVSDTMALWNGVDIAEQASSILGHEVKYLGDDMYQVIEDPVEEIRTMVRTRAIDKG